MDNNKRSGGGVGLFTVIAVVLAALKITGVINLSWGYIFLIWVAPILITAIILFSIWIVRRWS